MRVKTAQFACAVIAAAVSVLCDALPGRGNVVFFSNNKPAFDAAAAAAYTLLGTETFEESSLAAGAVMSFNGPLSQTSTTQPYPNGISQPMTVSVNGIGTLAAFDGPSGPNFSFFTSTVVIANASADTLDWSFSPSNRIAAVGLNPLTYSGRVSVNPPYHEIITVYDTDNNTYSTSVTTDDQGTNHLGILATAGTLITRINFQGMTSGNTDVSEGADNAALYVSAIPEPSAFWLVAVCVFVGAIGHHAARYFGLSPQW
jgi:hypothetical protein